MKFRPHRGAYRLGRAIPHSPSGTLQPLLVPTPQQPATRWRRLLRHWPLVLSFAAIVLWFLSGDPHVLVATLLAGSEAEAAGASFTVAVEKAYALKVTATSSGTVKEIKWKTAASGNTCTKLQVSIYTNVSGAPGAKLSGTSEVEEEKAVGNSKTETVSGLNCSVTNGTEYWVIILPLVGQLKWKQGSTASTTAINSTPEKVKEASKVTAWTGEAKGPIQLWAEGVAGAFVVPSTTTATTSTSAAILPTGQVIPSSATAETSDSATLQAGTAKVSGTAIATTSASLISFAPVTLVPATATATTSAEASPGAGIISNVYYGPAGEEAAELAKNTTERAFSGIRQLDVYPSPVANSPVVVFIHGGGFYQGERAKQEEECKNLQQAGVTVVNIDYLLDEATATSTAARLAFPMQVTCVEEAFKWAREHVGSYNGDIERMFMLGGSAGGFLAHSAAMKINEANTNRIKGVISLSSIGDLVQMIKDDFNNVEKVQGQWGKDVRKAIKNAPREEPKEPYLKEAEEWSWTKHLTSAGLGSHGALIFNSEGEEITPKDAPTLMKEAYEAAGARVVYEKVPGTGHSFAYWHKTTTAGKVVETRVLEFIQEVLIVPNTAVAATSAAAAASIVKELRPSEVVATTSGTAAPVSSGVIIPSAATATTSATGVLSATAIVLPNPAVATSTANSNQFALTTMVPNTATATSSAFALPTTAFFVRPEVASASTSTSATISHSSLMIPNMASSSTTTGATVASVGTIAPSTAIASTSASTSMTVTLLPVTLHISIESSREIHSTMEVSS